MAIVKRNNYLTDRNLTDLAYNVDYNRLGEDKIQITVSFVGSPATVTIHKGSIWECNGNRYIVEGADYTFQMDGAGHNYITFTDNPAVDFGSAAAIGTFSAEKQGYYQADNVTRTMKFYVDQTNENYYILLDNCLPDATIMTQRFDRLKVGLSGNWAGVGTIPLDTVYDDLLGSWDAVNYRFICVEAGYYMVTLQLHVGSNVGTSGSIIVGVVTHLTIYINSLYCSLSGESELIIYLNTGDIVTATYAGGVTLYAGQTHTFLEIARLL